MRKKLENNGLSTQLHISKSTKPGLVSGNIEIIISNKITTTADICNTWGTSLTVLDG